MRLTCLFNGKNYEDEGCHKTTIISVNNETLNYKRYTICAFYTVMYMNLREESLLKCLFKWLHFFLFCSSGRRQKKKTMIKWTFN